MKYEEFEDFVRQHCMYETIYDDSEGRRILVIKMIDAYYTTQHKMQKKEWQGLTDKEIYAVYDETERTVNDSWVGSESVGLMFPISLYKAIEAKLKEKNG